MSISKILHLFLTVSLLVLLISGCGSETDTDSTDTGQNGLSQVQQGGDIPHVLDGRDDCLGCHNMSTTSPVPADHEGRTNDECGDCHELAANPSRTTASAIPHTLAGRENCLGCHAEGTDLGVPASHVGRTSNVCTACHQPE
jgi:hypothetical protein